MLTVGLFGYLSDDEVWSPGVKQMMDDIHKRRILMSNAIYIINKNNYIGDSTKK